MYYYLIVLILVVFVTIYTTKEPPIFTEVKNLDSKLKINTENRNDPKHDTLKNTLIISVGEVKSLFE